MPTPHFNFVRPDFSQYVVHFTKTPAPIAIADDPDGALKKIAELPAFDRLCSILTSKELFATRMPWTNKQAICFTECTWSSLLDHANRYSRFGLGFTKEFLFANGGGPAIYLPPSLMECQKEYLGKDKQPFDANLFAFITPFMPYYATEEYKNKYWKGKKPVDYSHEREWRVPNNLKFEYGDVKFVIVDSYSDVAKAPKELKDAIGRDKWLIMENYATIESLWPVHKLPENDGK